MMRIFLYLSVILIASCQTKPQVKTKIEAVTGDCRFTGPGRIQKMIECHRHRSELAKSLTQGKARVWRQQQRRRSIDSTETEFRVCIGDSGVCAVAERGGDVAGVVVVSIGPVREHSPTLLSLLRDGLAWLGGIAVIALAVGGI